LENVVPTLLGAVKLVGVLRSLGLSKERQRIVLNRYTTLPGCVKPADVASRLGHAVDHVIPFDKNIVIAANTGEPYVLRPSRLFGCGRQLQGLVDDIDTMHEAWPLLPAPSGNGEIPVASHNSEVQPVGDERAETSGEDLP